MKLKLSMIYLGVYILTAIFIGIFATIIGDIFTAPVIFLVLSILGAELIVAVLIFENQMSFMDLSRLPKTEPEPEKDHGKIIKKYILDNLQKGFQFKTIIEALQRTGYANENIETVISMMYAEGSIRKKEPAAEQQPPVEVIDVKPEEEQEDVPPEPPKETKVKKEVKKKVKKKK